MRGVMHIDLEDGGDEVREAYPLFQAESGGASPTSPLQLTFREISLGLALKGYEKWHYLGDLNFVGSLHWGAYFNGLLEGAISFGPPHAKNLKGYWTPRTQCQWLEILRLAMSDKCPKNSESRFIGYCLRFIKRWSQCRGIITYADTAQGHLGTIYKATGFTYCGLTAYKTDFVVNGSVKQRGIVRGLDGSWIPRSRKHLFVKRLV